MPRNVEYVSNHERCLEARRRPERVLAQTLDGRGIRTFQPFVVCQPVDHANEVVEALFRQLRDGHDKFDAWLEEEKRRAR